MSVFDHVYYPFHHDHISTPSKHPPDNPLWTSDGWGGVAWKLGGYNPPGGGLDKSLPGLAAETAVWDPVPSNPTWSLQTCETTSAYVFDARGSHSISQVALQLGHSISVCSHFSGDATALASRTKDPPSYHAVRQNNASPSCFYGNVYRPPTCHNYNRLSTSWLTDWVTHYLTSHSSTFMSWQQIVVFDFHVNSRLLYYLCRRSTIEIQ